MAVQLSNNLPSHQFGSQIFNSFLPPDEILLLIFDQLSFNHLRSASLVSRKWNQLINLNLGLKIYHQLAKTVLPFDNGYHDIELNRTLLSIKVFAINFNESLGSKVKTYYETFLMMFSSQEGIDSHSLIIPSERLLLNFKNADFIVQEHHLIKKVNGEYTTWINGVFTTIINSGLSERQLKLIKEFQEDSPRLLKERQEKKNMKKI